MKPWKAVSVLSDPNNRSCLFSLVVAISLFCGSFFVRSAWLGKEFSIKLSQELGIGALQRNTNSTICSIQDKCRSAGIESLPKGIISPTSNLEMSPLWGPLSDDKIARNKSLLAVAVGIKQKQLVDKIVNKFLADDFAVMLFHYDGVVDKWHDLEWSNRVIHVSARNQTKWWFAKRFLHPDIVAEYEYIFLWDEDLGVENFNSGRYISIVKEESLEISQPALDSRQSEVHHLVTVRNRRSRVHRRYIWFKGNGPKCSASSIAPPCVGWVEVMAPVFSRAAWRCVWHMVQNDLIHAWGLDMKLGYCAQGDRSIKVGVVDEEYLVHYGLPTLGEKPDQDKAKSALSYRLPIRLRSVKEMKEFQRRWDKAVKEDECWVDPYRE
ncbi:uncharacterized protein LOC127251650 [Andrographis paniculata]|uniref:uncharacterized protein LOC127251650 n=1 Tax=Andrographis paniculata TaxID=175694 RepID=UPI0021E83FC0|nr:uncharacterized protein LOC127251650 [Andrographis paniculata]